jgi:hypothetical protein
MSDTRQQRFPTLDTPVYLRQTTVAELRLGDVVYRDVDADTVEVLGVLTDIDHGAEDTAALLVESCGSGRHHRAVLVTRADVLLTSRQR